MAEDLPPPSETSPLCLTRRTSVTNDDDDHNKVQLPTLTLSPPLLTTLEALLDGNQEEKSVNCSPNKPTRNEETENPSTIEGLRGSYEDGFPADEVGIAILGGRCHLVHVSDKRSKLEVGTESLDGGREFVVFESEKKNSILERDGASNECRELEDGVCIVERENVSKFVEVGISCENCSEKQTVEFGSGKKTENSERSDPKTGECLELKAESGFCEDFSKKENDNSEGSDTIIGSCKKYSEKKNGNFEGMLPKLVKNHGDNLKGNALTCSLKIEMVDGTALVDVVKIDGKKNKRMGRKGHAISIGGGAYRASNGGKRKHVYSRKEMEALRFVNVKGQKKFWQGIYYGFAQTVRKEYDELGAFRHHKPDSMRNYHGQGILGESTSENVSCDAETVSSPDFTGGKDGDDLVGEWSGQEESDDDYESIQRPAFWVEGEPDFESGPPDDGFEYLRRVRWEAAQIPKVKVAKIDNSKLNKEQSVYMPNIPDIDKCPPHLLPLQQWEDEFIADFSDLRLVLSRLEDTGDTEPESIIFLHKEHTSRLSESMKSLELPSGGPTLSAVMGMDPVTRVMMLKRRISLFDSASVFSKDDCAWLFALCAVVDTPLDADTSASLRCLLRRCAKLRAAKSELDDEVIMLNVLATISGKFFGQSET